MQFKGNIEETLQRLLSQEDTDGDKKITIEDKGPKAFTIDLLSENGFAKAYVIKGTYHLSNFLQELALEKTLGKTEATIPLSKIEETPSARVSRMIKDYFWDDLTRTLDADGLRKSLGDDKAIDTTQRLYVPVTDTEGVAYYQNIQQQFPNLEVVILPEDITPTYVKSINDKPGVLALALQEGKGVPFVVPGGRFNEMYGWDSYFEGVGLIIDGRIDLAKAMIDNFCYQITHYGKILNANRSYYLTRTQPPFLSSFIYKVYEADPSIGKEWLASVLKVAIQEYETVWMQAPRLTENGLNRYYAQGIGIPPETEEGHFDDVLSAFKEQCDAEVYAEQSRSAKGASRTDKEGKPLSVKEFATLYQSGELQEPKLDTYFTHDRSLRESGHDTSWRLDDVCADLNTVDLNSLLYKYELDFGYIIDTYFDGEFEGYNGSHWFIEAEERAERMNTLMWNEEAGQYFDYNFETGKQTNFESASNYFPFWAGLVDQERVSKMVKSLMRDLKEKGGIAGTSKAMHAQVPEGAVQRQWDYPNGWAPHQMMIWGGLKIQKFEDELQELIYRWLWMITRNAVDYNGTIPEKYDVVACTHKVYAEYGNVGTEFDYITTSGFGWMNASYQYGLSLLNTDLRNKLDQLVDPDTLFS
ncbi:alpha,alpha-trehalase [uncultured Dokdonia sp.]|uniref:alpha,alpha-trehalase n=1 Tax=uncultured Dokdonia sp. TaxID=575653 RepID=UPI00261BD568|nr:alpha,alpha-trehalase [uncultured Dokdonia sp.]